MILTLSGHYERASDMIASPPVPVTADRDSFGNWCCRSIAPKPLRLSNSALIRDSGLPDEIPDVPAWKPLLRD